MTEKQTISTIYRRLRELGVLGILDSKVHSQRSDVPVHMPLYFYRQPQYDNANGVAFSLVQFYSKGDMSLVDHFWGFRVSYTGHVYVYSYMTTQPVGVVSDINLTESLDLDVQQSCLQWLDDLLIEGHGKIWRSCSQSDQFEFPDKKTA